MTLRRKHSKKRLIFDLLLLASIPIWFYSCTNSIIFHPPACSYTRSANLVSIPVADSQHIAAYYLPGKDDQFVILFSHGNAEDIGQLDFFWELYRLQGFGILAYDYRGYGLSDGSPSEQHTYQDIDAAYHYLVDQQHIDPKRIIVHGRSVGSGPSTWLAERYPVGGLILESPFLSAYRSQTHWPILPFDKYNNLSRIKNIHCPLLVIHGKKDRIVGFWHGKTLYETANEPKMHYWVDDAGHNDLFEKAGNNYWKAIKTFKESILERQTQQEAN